MNTSNTLCLFIKAPRPGQVKTRMQPELSESQATSLYRAMVEDLLDRLAGHPDFDLNIFYWPPDGREELAGWLGHGYALIPQRGEHLGDRMYAALQDTLSGPRRKSIVIGSDIPDLDSQTVVEAFNALDHSDVVLGPSRDGGYYLVGLKKPKPELFRDITWGGDQVYSETIERLRCLKLLVTELSPLDDLDTLEDVKAYRQRLDREGAVKNPRLANICRTLFE